MLPVIDMRPISSAFYRKLLAQLPISYIIICIQESILPFCEELVNLFQKWNRGRFLVPVSGGTGDGSLFQFSNGKRNKEPSPIPPYSTFLFHQRCQHPQQIRAIRPVILLLILVISAEQAAEDTADSGGSFSCSAQQSAEESACAGGCAA